MKKKIISIILPTIILLLTLSAGIALGFEIYRSNFTLEVSRYEVSTPDITSDIRIVLLADLHNREFGAGNEQLLMTVRQ